MAERRSRGSARRGGTVLAPPGAGAQTSLVALSLQTNAHRSPLVLHPSFNTVMWVNGGNSLEGAVAITPGGVGINQAKLRAAEEKAQRRQRRAKTRRVRH